MARKTIEINKYKDFANMVLASNFGSSESRQGIISSLEFILHEADSYKGFRYLLQEAVPINSLPGVRYENGEILPYPERFLNTDDTRRFYY